ncbi:polysaccharide biosynthesis/export family protein [Elusimicrobiota bacterium]
MSSKFLFTLIAIFLLLGCMPPQSRVVEAPSAPSSGQEAQAQVEEAAIASVMSTIRSKRPNYKISPADLLEITVYRMEDLSRIIRVGQQGTISYPLVGVLEVGGKSVTDAEKELSGKLKEYLRDPQVTIFIKEYGNKQIFVLGEVKEPGSFDLPTESRLTVLGAISKAGGFTQVAAKDRTKVIRTGVNGKSTTFTIEVSAITSKGKKHKDISLEPNDVIYIPQSFF